MSVIDTIKGWIVRKAAAFGMIPMWEQGKPQYPPHNYYNFANEGYRKNEVVYSCIREKATSAIEPPLVAYRQRNGEREELPSNHPLVGLLNQPNPQMTQALLVAIWTINLDIAGNVYVAKERTNDGRVGQLKQLRPDRVKIIPDRIKGIGGYQYEVSGAQPRNIPAEDVIHDKFYDPIQDYYGLSPIAVASRLGDVDNEGTDFVKRFFEHGVQVPFWLVYKSGRLARPEKKRVRREFRKLYGGYKQWIEPGILDVDVDILRTGLDFKQMDFKFLRSMSESRICSIFGVPPILVGAEIGLERSTYSNYEEARKSFLSETMKPIWKQIEDALNMGLAPEFGDDVMIAFDLSRVEALQENVNEVWARATAAFQASAITREQFWQETGLEEPTDGVFMQPMMMIPVSVGEQAKAPPEFERRVKSVPLHEQKASRFARAVDLTARAWEGRFRDEARKLFAQERTDVLKILRKEGKAAKQGAAFQGFLIAVENYYNKAGDNWRKVFLPVFEALLISQGDNLATAFGISFDVTRPEVADFLNGYTMRFSDSVVQQSMAEIRQVILDGQEGGWTVPQMRKGIQDLFDENFEPYRAERIARSETIRSSNAGACEAYRQAGIERVQWWDGQAGACDYCVAMHETTISTREVFIEVPEDGREWQPEGVDRPMKLNYGDVGYPPLHPGCRCTTIPVVEI